ncbi:MAG: hypothetical protein IRZ18_06645 [Clostridia bacterium]|nr:hypothetical protein [Clostridia bacterium]
MTDAQRRTVEADLRAYPAHAKRLAELEAEIDELRRGFAARALPWPDEDQPRASGNRAVSDHVPVAVMQLWRTPAYQEYRRLEPLVRAIENAYRSLDEEHRRVMEAYYWRWPEAQAALNLSRSTLYRRRMRICRVVLRELRRAGVRTYRDPGGTWRVEDAEVSGPTTA